MALSKKPIIEFGPAEKPKKISEKSEPFPFIPQGNNARPIEARSSGSMNHCHHELHDRTELYKRQFSDTADVIRANLCRCCGKWFVEKKEPDKKIDSEN